MPRVAAIWNRIADSLWFVPGVVTIVSAAAAILLVQLDLADTGPSPDDLWFLFGGGADGARGVLGAIAGGIITVTGVVFSVTIVALQLTSTQFTPRVLRQFMADRANQIVLGVFIGTFTYTLLVQRAVRSGDETGGEFVPAFAVTGALVLALIAIGFLIFFIDHLARSIQAETIVARTAADTVAVVERHAASDTTDGPPPLPPLDRSTTVPAWRAGYVQAIDEDELLEAAHEHALIIHVHAPVGAFLLEGEPVASVWGGDGSSPADLLRRAFVVGDRRTPHQDAALGLVELVDIAVKALSPGINDPTTAMAAIDRMGQVVLAVARHSPGDLRVATDDGGAVRLVVPRLGFRRAVDLAFRQIRHFGASNPVVATRTATALRAVAERLPPDQREPLADQLSLLRDDAERAIPGPADRLRTVAAIEDAYRALAG